MNARFSVMGLMAVVLALAIGFAGLHNASALWASALFTITLTFLAAAGLGVAASRGRVRMACLGFSLFGWVYLVATFWLWPGPNGVTAPPLLTKALLDAARPPLKTPVVMTIDVGPVGEMMNAEPPPMVATTIRPGLTGLVPFTGRVVNLLHYRRIGHTLAAIAYGLLGGFLGSVFSAWSEASEGRRSNRDRDAGH